MLVWRVRAIESGFIGESKFNRKVTSSITTGLNSHFVFLNSSYYPVIIVLQQLCSSISPPVLPPLDNWLKTKPTLAPHELT
jgi:hypothetical protein